MAQEFDPRKMPMIAGITLEEFGDELRDVLSEILYVGGLDQLPAVAASLAIHNEYTREMLEVFTSIADRLSEIRDMLRPQEVRIVNSIPDPEHGFLIYDQEEAEIFAANGNYYEVLKHRNRNVRTFNADA